MEILTMLAPIISTGARSGIKRKGLVGITIHDTGNLAVGAGAKNHGLYLQGGGKTKQASWHYAVDKDFAVQSIPEDEVTWHAGDGTGNGNYKTIAIEICVNADGDIKKATDNAAQLAATLLKKYGLTIDNLYQHNHWSGKNCPAQIRKGNPYDWSGFKAKVSEFMAIGTNTPNKTETSNTGKNDAFKVGDTIAIQYPNGAYIADDVAYKFDIYQIKEMAIAGGNFDWEDNGVPEVFVDLVDSKGNKRADSDKVHAKKGDYFVYNRKFKVVATTIDNKKIYLRLDGGKGSKYYFWAVAERCKKS